MSSALLLSAIASGGMAGVAGETASGSIRAMATVVAPLGVTSPDDNRVTTSPFTSLGIGDVSRPSHGAQVLSLHRLLVRYPSAGSVSVSVQTNPGSADNFSLQEWIEPEDNEAWSRPGAVLIDLSEQFDCVTDPDNKCVITLIYTEN